jgi:hypothetical protein
VTPAEGGALAVAAVAAAAAVRWMPAPAAAVGRRRRLRPVRGEPAPAELNAYRRMLRLAVASEAEAHHRLVPTLRDVAAQRLAAYRRVDLAADPEGARRALAPGTWELLRPDRPAPADRHARGPRLAELEAAIEDLERLAGG